MATKPKTAAEYWKVHVYVNGAALELATNTEPVIRARNGRIFNVDMDVLAERSVVVGFIDWSRVTAVTWCKA